MQGEFPVAKMLLELSADSLLPAILFRTSRRQCDFDVEKLAATRIGVLPEEDQETIRREVEAVILKYGMDSEVIFKHAHYQALVRTASGAHHAGQLLLWRLLLEEMMTRGMLRLMIATGTVAAGVDFPARTVVITAHSRRGSEGFEIISSSEFQQMAGRAGRRGKDAVGICLIAPSPFSDARVISEVSKKPPEPLRSAYYAAPATVLNLLKFRTADDLRYTVSKSLAAFLDRKSARTIRAEAEILEGRESDLSKLSPAEEKKLSKRGRRMLRDADALDSRQIQQLEKSLAGLDSLGFVKNGHLTEKGLWAANLCTSLVLELAEAIDTGLLTDLSVEELVGIVAAIAGDPHRPYFRLKANPLKKEYYKSLEEIVERIRANIERPGASEIKVLPDAALTVLSWMESASWTEFAGLLKLAGVAEGDVARLVTQTADHLNQIARLHETHPFLAAQAEEGRRRILKPPLTEAIVVRAGE